MSNKSVRKIKAGINTLTKRLKVSDPPIHIQLEPTTACNLACITCSRDLFIKKSRHMKLEEFKRVIEQIRPLKITLSGFGEPFTNNRLTEMIAYAEENGISVNTTSNMTLIDEKLAEKIVDCRLELLKISIDAARPDTYMRIRGEDCHQKLIDGIKFITRVKKEKGVKHPSMRFNFVVQKENFKEMTEVVEIAHNIGVEAIYFQPLEMIDIVERKDSIVGDMSKEELLSEFKRAYNAANAYDVPTNLKSLIDDIDTFWKKYVEVGVQNERRICALPWLSTYITVDGDVLPCCSFSTTPEGAMGNIFREDFMDIWNKEKYRKFRKAIREGKRPYRICQNCVPKTLWDMVKYSRISPGFLKKGK